jgi:hypothetical protein
LHNEIEFTSNQDILVDTSSYKGAIIIGAGEQALMPASALLKNETNAEIVSKVNKTDELQLNVANISDNLTMNNISISKNLSHLESILNENVKKHFNNSLDDNSDNHSSSLGKQVKSAVLVSHPLYNDIFIDEFADKISKVLKIIIKKSLKDPGLLDDILSEHFDTVNKFIGKTKQETFDNGGQNPKNIINHNMVKLDEIKKQTMRYITPKYYGNNIIKKYNNDSHSLNEPEYNINTTKHSFGNEKQINAQSIKLKKLNHISISKNNTEHVLLPLLPSSNHSESPVVENINNKLTDEHENIIKEKSAELMFAYNEVHAQPSHIAMATKNATNITTNKEQELLKNITLSLLNHINDTEIDLKSDNQIKDLYSLNVTNGSIKNVTHVGNDITTIQLVSNTVTSNSTSNNSSVISEQIIQESKNIFIPPRPKGTFIFKEEGVSDSKLHNNKRIFTVASMDKKKQHWKQASTSQNIKVEEASPKADANRLHNERKESGNEMKNVENLDRKNLEKRKTVVKKTSSLDVDDSSLISELLKNLK